MKAWSKALTVTAALLGGYALALGTVGAIAVAANHLPTTAPSAAEASAAPSAPASPAPIMESPQPPKTLGDMAYKKLLMLAEAKTLGMTVTQLSAALGHGMTVQQLAASKHFTEAQFRAALIPNVALQLDMAVADQRLTNDQEQLLLLRLRSGPIPYWTSTPTPSPTPAQK
jgi:hypothetical protein